MSRADFLSLARMDRPQRQSGLCGTYCRGLPCRRGGTNTDGTVYVALMERDLSMRVDEIVKKQITIPNIKHLRERLSPDPDKSLTQERFGQFMGVSWSTVARWEGGGNPGPQMTKRLFRLEQALQRLEGLILREDRLPFFDQPNATLLGARPIELLDNDAATKAVMQLIEGIETGAF